MNCSIMMYNNRPSFTIVPGFICESAVARWHNQHESFLHQWMWRAQPPELAGLSSLQHDDVENGLLDPGQRPRLRK